MGYVRWASISARNHLRNMKNLLIFLLLALSVPAFAQSQTISPPKQDSKPAFSLSVIGGLNVNQMLAQPNLQLYSEFKLNDARKPEKAYFLGISANQPLNRRFAAKLDAQYVVKGFATDIEVVSSAAAEHYQVSYLEFSPQIAVTFFQHFQLLLGGYGEIRIQERWKYMGQDWGVANPDGGLLANKSDWGLLGGMSFQMNKVSLFAKYLYGVTPVWEIEYFTDVGKVFEADSYHRSIQIGLGFKLL